METIKNLLRPGHAIDDEALYGQREGEVAASQDHHSKGGITGEGSHLAGAREGTTSLGQSHGTHDPALAGKSDGLSNPGSSPYPMNSGVDSSNTQSTSTPSGPHRSDLANKADPRIDSDNPRVTGNETLGSTAGGEGESGTSSGRAFPLSSDTQSKHDPQSTASSRGIKTAQGEDYTADQKTTVGLDTSDNAKQETRPFDSNASRTKESGVTGTSGGYPSTSGGTHHTGSTGAAVGGPHQTSTANRLDPNFNNYNEVGREDATRHYEQSHTSGGGSTEADRSHRTAGAALGAGAIGLGATGAASQTHNSGYTDQGASQTSQNAPTSSSTGNQSSMPGAYPESTASTTGNATPQTYNTGVTDRPRGIDDPSSTTGEKDHHYGRDAALAGGVAGLAGGAYGASRHTDGKSASGPHTSDTLNRADPRVDNDRSGGAYGTNPVEHSHVVMTGASTGAQSGHATTAGPHSSNLANKADPRVDSDRSQETNYGRDAALGAGGVGTAGAAYGATRHHDHQQAQTSSTNATAGPHSSDLANKADPRVDSDRSKETHHGRDAALGAGAVGATGAAYGASKHPENQAQDTSVKTTAGPHSSDLANKADPRVDSDRSHHGRDATLGAGAVGTAGTTYGASKHHDAQPQPQPHGVSTTTTTTTNTSTTTSGPHRSDLANKADPRVDSDRSKEQDSNHGRNAAMVGGAGAAGAAAYGAHKYNESDDKEAKLAQKEHDKQMREAEKQHAHDVKHAQKEHDKQVHAAEKKHEHAVKEHDKQLRDNDKRDAKDEKHTEKKEHKGLFSFLHRDKNKKYTKEEEEEFDRQEREHNARNTTASTAAAGAGVGAGAYAAHQAHKAHEDHDPHGKGHTPVAEQSAGSTIGDKLHGSERNRGIVGTTGFPHGGEPHGHIAVDSAIPGTEERLGSVSGGAPHTDEQRGSTIGDKLHGTERYRGVPGETGYVHGGGPHDDKHQTTIPGTEGHVGSASGQYTTGRRPSAGDYNTDQHGNIIGSGTDTRSQDHHATGTTEHSKVGSTNQPANTVGGSTVPGNTTSKTGELGHDTTGRTVGEQQLGGTPGQGAETGDLGHGHERNRLHKNPPAGHPAAGNLS